MNHPDPTRYAMPPKGSGEDATLTLEPVAPLLQHYPAKDIEAGKRPTSPQKTSHLRGRRGAARRRVSTRVTSGEPTGHGTTSPPRSQSKGLYDGPGEAATTGPRLGRSRRQAQQSAQERTGHDSSRGIDSSPARDRPRHPHHHRRRRRRRGMRPSHDPHDETRRHLDAHGLASHHANERHGHTRAYPKRQHSRDPEDATAMHPHNDPRALTGYHRHHHHHRYEHHEHQPDNHPVRRRERKRLAMHYDDEDGVPRAPQEVTRRRQQPSVERLPLTVADANLRPRRHRGAVSKVRAARLTKPRGGIARHIKSSTTYNARTGMQLTDQGRRALQVGHRSAAPRPEDAGWEHQGATTQEAQPPPTKQPTLPEPHQKEHTATWSGAPAGTGDIGPTDQLARQGREDAGRRPDLTPGAVMRCLDECLQRALKGDEAEYELYGYAGCRKALIAVAKKRRPHLRSGSAFLSSASSVAPSSAMALREHSTQRSAAATMPTAGEADLFASPQALHGVATHPGPTARAPPLPLSSLSSLPPQRDLAQQQQQQGHRPFNPVRVLGGSGTMFASASADAPSAGPPQQLEGQVFHGARNDRRWGEQVPVGTFVSAQRPPHPMQQHYSHQQHQRDIPRPRYQQNPGASTNARFIDMVLPNTPSPTAWSQPLQPQHPPHPGAAGMAAGAQILPPPPPLLLTRDGGPAYTAGSETRFHGR